MNSVPAAFLDAVCSQLESKDLENLENTNDRWSSIAAMHGNQRRELLVYLFVNDEGTQVGIEILDDYGSECTFSSLQPKYDRIETIELGLCVMGYFNNLSKKTSLKCFEKKILPLLRSLAFECGLRLEWQGFLPNFRDILFNGLRGCSQLTKIYCVDYDGCAEFTESFAEFIQSNLGQLEHLALYGSYKWPDVMKMHVTSFLRSPNFEGLSLSDSNLTLDFDMVSCFVERFLKGDIAYYAYLHGEPTFPLDQFDYLFVDEQRKNSDAILLKRHYTETSTVTNSKSQVIVKTVRTVRGTDVWFKIHNPSYS
uniref:F-box domain-containing protein n=1 Tax=Steinernema glaseri TaxID=37863 RepID=A0A1I7YID2_9BILA